MTKRARMSSSATLGSTSRQYRPSLVKLLLTVELSVKPRILVSSGLQLWKSRG